MATVENVTDLRFLDMEIPKMKILIYTLTFLGYAWSGYGSGLLGNLRDAILAAEEFFGHFLENAVEVLKKLNEGYRVLDASGDNCKFSCPSGNSHLMYSCNFNN